MDEKRKAEALWAYSITQERIMDRLVKKGSFSQKRANEILNMLIDNLEEKSIEEFSQSNACKNIIADFLHPLLDSDSFVSLTDPARTENNDNPSYVIQSWLRSRNTIEFLRLWEKNNNPSFNDDECNRLIDQLKVSSFTLTAKKWISMTKAHGLISKQGNKGGTLAHPEIALDFQLWLYPEKRYEIIKEVLKDRKTD